ncbi:MAG: winged helix DNA-binding domain-containing protein [Chloroflexi bacterium]|nr:winged helix DNA-binding domain-containing protein [Chloroflexota bacterium]MCL5075860.1 winged helix DNA-binding domain-containing protein [Chloroflexota bacterium]
MITLEDVQAQRDRRYWRCPDLRIRNEDQAVEFIDEVGFCSLFPVQGLELPSLWEAINGASRELPHHHHDYELNCLWEWKDTLPIRKKVVYGKFIRQKPTFISLSMFPYFYALSGNYGELEDYLDEYRDGRLSEEAKRIYEVLIEQGPLPTSILRRETGLYGQQYATRFDRALVELQSGFKIVKSGISDANRWKYCYVYDILIRWSPEAIARASHIKSKGAMQHIVTKYLQSVIIATEEGIARLFAWDLGQLQRLVTAMIGEGLLQEVTVEGLLGRWLMNRGEG